MDQIDYIYYQATSTDQTTGFITNVQAQYYVPFLDLALIALTFSFTILAVWFAHYLLYRK